MSTSGLVKIGIIRLDRELTTLGTEEGWFEYLVEDLGSLLHQLSESNFHFM
jgi:hypothetical protein